MWGLYVDSSMSFSYSMKSFSNDMYIFSTTDNSEHETFFLGSPHLDILTKEEHDTAYYRAKALIKLLNGCLLLEGDLTFSYGHEIYIINEKGEFIHRSSSRENDLNIQEYEELRYPFQNKAELRSRAEKSFIGDCITLAREDEIVHQTIIFLNLSRLDVLYQLNNTYKIFENIIYDLGYPKSEEKYKKKVKGTIPSGLEKYLDYFYTGDFRHYANSEMGSHILARHGHSKSEYTNKQPLNLKTLDYNARNLVNHWLRVKMEKRFGYHYHVEYKPKIAVEMTDGDYDFDLN